MNDCPWFRMVLLSDSWRNSLLRYVQKIDPIKCSSSFKRESSHWECMLIRSLVRKVVERLISTSGCFWTSEIWILRPAMLKSNTVSEIWIEFLGTNFEYLILRTAFHSIFHCSGDIPYEICYENTCKEGISKYSNETILNPMRDFDETKASN